MRIFRRSGSKDNDPGLQARPLRTEDTLALTRAGPARMIWVLMYYKGFQSERGVPRMSVQCSCFPSPPIDPPNLANSPTLFPYRSQNSRKLPQRLC